MSEQSSFTLPHQLQQFQLHYAKEQLLYKNRLQEFAQRANLPLPSYHTVSEQEPRESNRFRSTVEVDGKKYTSLKTFSTRKAAEQDVAKLALEGISKTIKNYVSNKTVDEAFPRIHEDRTFSKSILNEFAAKKKLAAPTYETVRLESVVPLFVSSLVFDGVKYTGEPSLNKKEAEQFAARAVILSLLANSGVETLLSEIVKSKAKFISAVYEHSKVNTSVSNLPNSGSDAGTYAIKEIVSDNGKQTTDMTETSEEIQQQSASKKARLPDSTTEFRQPNLETVSEPSFLPRYQTIPQPSLFPSSQTLPQQSLVSNTQALPQPSLLPSTQTFPQPSLLPNSNALSQPILLSGPQTYPQLSLLPNCNTLPQPSLLPSTQTLPQPSLLPDSQMLSQHSQSSLLPNSQTLPQPNCLPINFIPSPEAQTPSNESASSRRRKKKKANKKAKDGMQMQISNLPPSQVPPCTIAH
ncbi:uncharacterized protein LOC141610523 isoform X2 [Silene latifolia]|uniref:uncharacterized protein LOC141610523 isoform X2 n=1 Tax=Silene latifolia TaxID=37657 RepID=UPI003D772AE5